MRLGRSPMHCTTEWCTCLRPSPSLVVQLQVRKLNDVLLADRKNPRLRLSCGKLQSQNGSLTASSQHPEYALCQTRNKTLLLLKRRRLVSASHFRESFATLTKRKAYEFLRLDAQIDFALDLPTGTLLFHPSSPVDGLQRWCDSFQCSMASPT